MCKYQVTDHLRSIQQGWEAKVEVETAKENKDLDRKQITRPDN
jgi:hypothetical protein